MDEHRPPPQVLSRPQDYDIAIITTVGIPSRFSEIEFDAERSGLRVAQHPLSISVEN